MAYLKDSPRNVFQGLTYSEPVPQFTGVVDYTRPLERLEKISNETNALADIVKPVENLDKDIDFLKNRMDYYKSNLSSVAENPDLSPHQKQRETRKLAQEYIEDVNHGQLGAIKGSYLSRQKDVEEAYKAYNRKEKPITKKELESRLQEAIDNYEGAIQKEDGSYNRYSALDKTNYVNPEIVLEDMAKGWMKSGIKGVDPNNPNQIADWKPTPDGEWMKKVGKGWEGVSKKEMYPVLLESIKNDSELQSSIIAEARAEGYLSGLRGEELNAYIQENAGKSSEAALNRVLEKFGWGITSYTSDMKQGAKESATGKAAFDSNANPTRTIEGVTNNPDAIPDFTAPSEQITLNDFLKSKGIDRNYIPNTSVPGGTKTEYLVNNNYTTQSEYNTAVDSATKEYEGFIQLKGGNLNGFLQNPAIKEKYGELPAEIVAKTPQGEMTNEEYTKFVTNKINEKISYFKTLPYSITPTSNTEAAKAETQQLKGTIKLDKNGDYLEGSIGELAYANLFLTREDSDGEQYNLENLAKKLKTTPEKIATSLSRIGATKGDNPFTAAGVEYTIRNSEGRTVHIIVSDKNLSTERHKVNEDFHKASIVLRNPRVNKSEQFNMLLPTPDGKMVDVRAVSVGHDIWHHYDDKGKLIYSDNSPSISNKGLGYLKENGYSAEDATKIANNSSYGGRYATIRPTNTDEFEGTPQIIVSDKDGGIITMNDFDDLTTNQDIYMNRSGSKNLSSRNKAKYFYED